MSSTWWPAAGYRNPDSGPLAGVGNAGFYWSSSRHSNAYYSCNLYFYYSGGVAPSNYGTRSGGMSVRCVQEEGRGALAPRRATWVVRGRVVSESSEATVVA